MGEDFYIEWSFLPLAMTRLRLLWSVGWVIEQIMNGWSWLAIGLMLLSLEMLIPSTMLFLCAGGVSLVVAGMVALGLAPLFWQQGLLFFAVGLLPFFWLRRYWLAQARPSDSASLTMTLEGQEIELTQDVQPGGHGMGELRGSPWPVVSLSRKTLQTGMRVRVVRQEGLTLFVQELPLQE